MKDMPRKPTQTFGHISFAKDGTVTQHLFRLSAVKPLQEQEALERFIEKFNVSMAECQLTNLRQLPENDHDFLLEVAGVETQVQLTELVDRSFTCSMDPAEYHAGAWTSAVLKSSGEIPWRIDTEKRDQALTDLIAQKIAKHYAVTPGCPLWLIIFATFHYDTEYVTAGICEVAEGLYKARRYLAGLPQSVFNEVWFTDLQTRPVRVWPHDNRAV